MSYREQVAKTLSSLSKEQCEVFFKNLHQRKMISVVPGDHELVDRIVMENVSSSVFEIGQLDRLVKAFLKYGDLNLSEEGNSRREKLCEKIDFLINEVKTPPKEWFVSEIHEDSKTKDFVEGFYKEADVQCSDLTIFKLLRPDKTDEILSDFGDVFVDREDLKEIKAIYKGYRNRIFSGKGALVKYQKAFMCKYYQELQRSFDFKLIGKIEKDSFVLKTDVPLQELIDFTRDIGYNMIKWTEFQRKRVELDSKIYKKAGVYIHSFPNGSIKTYGMPPKYTFDFVTTFSKLSLSK